jgi:hypothetical protein
MTADANLYQYPPGDFRWRPWLLIERIDEVFAAAQRAGMCQPSLRDPRGAWALDRIDRDPFVAAVWNCDQILKPDHFARSVAGDVSGRCGMVLPGIRRKKLYVSITGQSRPGEPRFPPP